MKLSPLYCIFHGCLWTAMSMVFKDPFFNPIALQTAGLVLIGIGISFRYPKIK